MRIAVLGYIVRGPLGGLVWHHLQYVLGLHGLGHDVYFIEDSDDYECCYDPSTGTVGRDATYGLRFIQAAFDSVGLGDRWAYFDAHRNEWLGPSAGVSLDIFRTADLLLNLSGVNPVRDWTVIPPRRALIDTDPVFTQVRHLQKHSARHSAAAHNCFFTFAENYGKPLCSVPDDGLPWSPTRQPVVMDLWPAAAGSASPFTTVMQWESYPGVSFNGQSFGMKSASFAPYMALPRWVSARMELAVGSANAPREELRSNGWIVTDPLEVTKTPQTYQQFIRSSRGEFTVAKHGYVASRSGWFSERSAAYLASARPVVTQDTGIEDVFPTGHGVLSFDSPEAAVECIHRVNSDYSHHCRSARAVAEEVFRSDRVLTHLVTRALTGAASMGALS